MDRIIKEVNKYIDSRPKGFERIGASIEAAANLSDPLRAVGFIYKVLIHNKINECPSKINLEGSRGNRNGI